MENRDIDYKKVVENIKSAIIQKDIEKLPDLLENIKSKSLDKDILNLSFKSLNRDIIELVLEKTNPLSIDNEIIAKTIETKDTKLIKSVADSISKRAVFEENKTMIQDAILDRTSVKNIAAQLLSNDENDFLDCELQEVVMEMYHDVVSKHYKEGDLPSKFPIKNFLESIKESTFFIGAPEQINLKSLYNKDRFLLLPVYSKGHAFCSYTKKLDEDKYSITFVNLGLSKAQKENGAKPYEEYIFTKKKAQNIFDLFSLQIRKEYPERAVDADFAYHTIKYFSQEKHPLNVTSAEQKVGNCFIKNMEKGIRYALSLALSKSLDPDFSHQNLIINAKDKDIATNYKVKFLKPLSQIHSGKNSYNTLKVRKEFINWLINRFPQYKNEITGEWNLYKSRKIVQSDKEIIHKNNFKKRSVSYPNLKMAMPKNETKTMERSLSHNI